MKSRFCLLCLYCFLFSPIILSAQAPDIDIRGGSPPQSIADGDDTPSTYDGTDFGGVNVDGEMHEHIFQIWNTGTMDLFITPYISDSGPDSADFYQAYLIRYDLPITPGSYREIFYRFDPSGYGVRTTTLTLTSNDPDEGTYDFILQGTGVTPEMDVQGNGYSIPDGGGHSTHNSTAFGFVFTGSSDTHTFTIENTGEGDLRLTASPIVSIGGLHVSDFTVTAQPSSPVASGGGTTTFDVRFQPSAPGQRMASLSIASNDEDENPYDIGLDGYGLIEVAFTNGADASLNFIQTPPAPPVNNWPIGQFSLSASEDAVLGYVTVDLDGTYTGLAGAKPFRIYASDTNDFGTAAARGFDAAASGGTVTVEAADAMCRPARGITG